MIVFLILCLVLAVLGGAFYAYRVAFFSPKGQRHYEPSFDRPVYAPYRETITDAYEQLEQKTYESVWIDSLDGLRLHGRYYHTADGAPLDIGFHGYRSSALLDFCGGAGLSLEMGHNLLLVDQRCHGESGGCSITFGIREREDVLCWVRYAQERFGADVPIILYGVSMGAATVLMASELDLPENVKGIVADCPYGSALDIILEVARKRGYPLWLIKPLVLLGARIYGGFDLKASSPEQAVQRARIPILLIHGESDGFVPCEMSEKISRSNPKLVTRVTFPGADHGFSYLADTPRYWSVVQDFMKRILA